MSKKDTKMTEMTEAEKAVANGKLCLECRRDPLTFVKALIDWKQVRGSDGPRKWQIEALELIGKRLKERKGVIRISIRSGHGVGKSALISWLILWSMATRPLTRGVVSANTGSQLERTVWPELNKWLSVCKVKDMFRKTQNGLYSRHKDVQDNYKFERATWDAANIDAFQGLHNEGKRLCVFFDEASSIPTMLFNAIEGAMTDSNQSVEFEGIIVAFGNPVTTSGHFWKTFKCPYESQKWDNITVNAEEVEGNEDSQLFKDIEMSNEGGRDSDEYRYRVLGEFPNSNPESFIPRTLVDKALMRSYGWDEFKDSPTIISCDPAWLGTDDCVIAVRRGFKFQILESIKKVGHWKPVAAKIANYEDKWKADAVLIESGIGSGLYSFAAEYGRNWRLVDPSSSAADLAVDKDDSRSYQNAKAYWWMAMKQWLAKGGQISCNSLADELCGPLMIEGAYGKIGVESKALMKKRGLKSPNLADALAISFGDYVVKDDSEGDGVDSTIDFNPLEGF